MVLNRTELVTAAAPITARYAKNLGIDRNEQSADSACAASAAHQDTQQPNAIKHRQSAVGQKAGIGISGPAFCPRLSAFVTWNGGPNSNIRSCVAEGRNPESGGFYIVHVDPAFCLDPFRG